jgi:hypothetical protein
MMLRDEQAQSSAQLGARPNGSEPDRTVLRVYEWRGAENRYVESIVEWRQGRGFALYEIKPDGSKGEPLKELKKCVAQRLSLFDYHEMPVSRKPPLLLIDIRQLNSLKLTEENTVVVANVEVFCFFGVNPPGSVLLELRLKAESSQVTLTKIEVSDIELTSPNARVDIGAPVVLSKAGMDSARPPNLQMFLPYETHLTTHFLNRSIGLDLDAVDGDFSQNRGRWQLEISFPKLQEYLTPTSQKALPDQRNFRTIRFDLTTHKFNSRRGGKVRLAGFLTHGPECSTDPPASAERSIPAAGGLQYRDFPPSFTITQRAPLSTGAVPIPPAPTPSGPYVVNAYLLHLRGVPGFVVPDQWNALLPDYFHALEEVQGGRPISFAPQLTTLTGGTGSGFWTLTYRIEDRWKTNSAPENAYYAISLHQQPDPGNFALFNGTLESVKALDQSSIGPLLLQLQSSDSPDADPFERLETEQGIVLETPNAIGLDPKHTALMGPLDSNTVRMGALDLEFSSQGDVKDTNQAINKLVVRPEACRVSVHLQAEFALKRILPGGQDDPDGEEYVPENQLNAGFMSACLTGTKNEPLSSTEQKELKIEAGFQRKRALVIVPDRPNQPTGTYVLSVTEDVQGSKNQTVALTVRSLTPAPPPGGVDLSKPCDALSGSGFVDVVVLDSNPFLVARVRAQPFFSPDLFKGTAVAS